MRLLQKLRYPVVVIAVAAVWSAGQALGIGFFLKETKEDLKLLYDVSVRDDGRGRVTVVLTLADEGRLKPLDGVQLVIPDQEGNTDGGHLMDLVVSIDMTKIDDGKRVGRIYIRKDLAQRAKIHLNTHTRDGKTDPMTRSIHVIPITKYMNNVPAQSK